jgi:putative oxidoreductase
MAAMAAFAMDADSPSTTLRVLYDQGDPMGDDMMSNSLFAMWSPRLLSVLRVVAALLFLQHGLAKLLRFPHVPMFDQLQPFSLLGLAGLIELVGSALLLVGLFTRPVAFIMSGEMAVAYFMAHAPRGFFPILNQGELAILFCFVFLYLAPAGGGPWSVDTIRTKNAS